MLIDFREFSMRSGQTQSTCDYIEYCGFYWNNRMNHEVERRKLIHRYCLNHDTKTSCARILYLLDTGELPSSEITPEGDAIGVTAIEN